MGTVSFNFDVAGPSRYLTIGVFDPDEDLEAEVVMGDNPQMAYYFFDDFQLQELSPEEVGIWLSWSTRIPNQTELEAFPSMCRMPFLPMETGSTTPSVRKSRAPCPRSVEDGRPLGRASDAWQLDPGNPEWDGRDMEGRPLAPGHVRLADGVHEPQIEEGRTFRAGRRDRSSVEDVSASRLRFRHGALPNP